jgi:hypothetical protein
VLAFPRLAFTLSDAERRFLDPRWADPKAKNVSVRWPSGELRGAAGDAGDLAALRAMVVRFAEQSEALALRLFPHYRGHLRRGSTSFGRPTSPAAYAAGARTTPGCTSTPSVQPDAGHPAIARLQQRQPDAASRALARRRAVRGARQALSRPDRDALARLGVADGDDRYHQAPAHRVRPRHAAAARSRQGRCRLPADESAGRAPDFAPGTTWVCFSDQVLHAALGGQHMMEQTFLLDVEHLHRPETSPLRTLERLLQRPCGSEPLRRPGARERPRRAPTACEWDMLWTHISLTYAPDGIEDCTSSRCSSIKKEAFERLCASQDLTPSQVVRQLIRDY